MVKMILLRKQTYKLTITLIQYEILLNDITINETLELNLTTKGVPWISSCHSST